MSRRVLVAFVDAFGPRQLQMMSELFDFLPYRSSLRGTMGYSSGALPTILTGASPAIHGRMCLFSAPEHGRSGVLTPLLFLGLLPRVLHERVRVRSMVARALSRVAGVTGYVALHRVPPAAFRWLDIPEREDLFQARDIGGVPTFLADARRAGLDVYAAPWQLGEVQRWQNTHDVLTKRQPRLTFLYASALDNALHRHGNAQAQAMSAGENIAKHIARARKALSTGLEGGVRDVLTVVVGDHGMADVRSVIDPSSLVDKLKDQRIFVDSTMIRFWGDKQQLARCRLAVDGLRAPGIWLDMEALAERQVPTQNAPYGNAVFLLDEGALFAPSFLGGRVRGMHGYDISCASAQAALASDHPIPGYVRSTANVADYIRNALGLSAGENTRRLSSDAGTVKP